MNETLTVSLRQLAQRMKPGCKVLRSWPLTGGVSAQVIAMKVLMADGGTKELVLRVHGERDRQQNPQVAADEFRLLQALQAAGIPSPAPFYLDQSCEMLPNPYLVVEYIEGETKLAEGGCDACLRALALHLAAIHRVRVDSLHFLPRLADQVLELLAFYPASHGQQHIIGILQAAWPWSTNPLGLLHGDYWPGNVLWQGDKLMGVIDWEDAKLGDPLGDLANTRLELLWAQGVPAMDGFTKHYCSITDIDLSSLLYWDLWVALRKTNQLSEWGLDALTEQRMKSGLAVFTQQALKGLRL